MQEQPTPSNQAMRRFSDAEAREIYKRAAQIESKTLFVDDDSLSGAQVENAANSAGISDEAVYAAIAQIEREREEAKAQAKAQAVAKAKTRRHVMIVGGILAGAVVLSGMVSHRKLSTSYAAVESTRANVEATLQRRQDLIPNLVSLARANLGNQRELIAALGRPNVDGATVQRAVSQLESKGIQAAALDEWAGTENRITVARRRFNESASQYNRNASGFPTSAWRGVFGLPTRVEPFTADKSAQVAPKFE